MVVKSAVLTILTTGLRAWAFGEQKVEHVYSACVKKASSLLSGTACLKPTNKDMQHKSMSNEQIL